MLVSETFVNETRGWVYSESPPCEPWTFDLGRLFRYAQQEFGRCVSCVYVDTPAGPKKIGWVFEKRCEYEDTGEPYLRQVWVQFHRTEDLDTIRKKQACRRRKHRLARLAR